MPNKTNESAIKNYNDTENPPDVSSGADAPPEAARKPTGADENIVLPVLPPPELSLDAMKKKLRRMRRVKMIKRIVGILFVLLLLLGLSAVFYTLFFKQEKMVDMDEPVYRGSMSSMIRGWGFTKPVKSEPIVVKAGGTVKEVFVSEGDVITAGTPLYEIDSTLLLESIRDAELKLTNAQKDLDAVYKNVANLTIRTPFAGKAVDVKIKKDDELYPPSEAGIPICTYVNDSVMKLTQFFSYAYVDAIKPGMSARVSITSAMSSVQGRVDSVERVNKITPEGTVLFKVNIVMDNPGALVKDMTATAVITSASGEEMYPNEAGTLDYSQSVDLVAKAKGKVSVMNLNEYETYPSGVVVCVLEDDSFDETIREHEKIIRDASDALAELQEQLESMSKTASVDGTVLNITLIPGQVIDANSTVMTISNMSSLIVEAQISESDVMNVKVGMPVEFHQYTMDGERVLFGTVKEVSLQGKNENGYFYFPADITVDNDGSLMPNMGLDFTINVESRTDCLIAPVQSVQNTPMGECVFLKTDTRPENAYDLSEFGITVPEGHFAVPVVTGIGNENGIEILEGLSDGDEVYTQTVPEGFNGDMGGPMGRAIMVG